MIRQFIRTLIAAVGLLVISPAAFFSSADTRLDEIEAFVTAEEYQKALIALHQMNEGQALIHKKTDYFYSVCYNRIGLYKMALQYSERCLSGDSDIAGRYEYAVANFGLENYEDARSSFQAVEAYYQEEQDFLYYYGNTLYYAEDYLEAMDRLEQLDDSTPDSEYLNYNLYNCYYETEEYVRGLRQVEKDIRALEEEDEDDWYYREDLLYYRADFNYYCGRYQDAIADYEKLVNEDSYYLDEVYYLLARCYVQLGENELAYQNIELGLAYDSYYYYEEYQHDEVLQDLFEDDQYQEKIEALEQIYEYYDYSVEDSIT